MLKTSPVVSSSANASPTSFRRAPTPAACPTPRRSTSRATSSASTSMKSPAPPRPRRHGSSNAAATAAAAAIAVAAASASASGTANSSSDDGGASAVAALDVDDSSSARDTSPIAPPPEPKPSSMAKSKSVDQLSAASSKSKPPPDASVAAQIADLSTISPVKRRGSPSTAAGSAAQTIDISDPASPARAEQSSSASKRARPDEQPPKVLPQRYELCAVEDVVELIAHMLAELIATNDGIQLANSNLTRFHSRTAPGISVRDYLHRLAKHATLTPPLLLAMVYYIDRLCAMYPDFTINTLTVHRFLITAATVAAKGLSDSFWNNTTYARVGGVRLAELKLLELEFLHRVDWKIVPNPEVLVAYYQGLIGRTPGYELEDDGSSDDMDEDDEDDDEDGDDDGAGGGGS